MRERAKRMVREARAQEPGLSVNAACSGTLRARSHHAAPAASSAPKATSATRTIGNLLDARVRTDGGADCARFAGLLLKGPRGWPTVYAGKLTIANAEGSWSVRGSGVASRPCKNCPVR
jgi:hypothetical protein